jgi:TRAP-type C4-dicarboxylate transport system permease large subunit
METAAISAMILFIVASSKGYSQILAITGISNGVTAFMTDLTTSPLIAATLVLTFVIILGCFMDQVSVIFVSIPLFTKVMHEMTLDPVWFGVLFSIAVGIGGITPPFGLNLFVLKGVSPPGVSMRDVYSAAVPFVLIELVALALVLLMPQMVIWVLL